MCLTIPNNFPGLMLLGAPQTAFALCAAGVLVFVIGIVAAKNDFAQAHGLDKIAVLSNLCFAIPLAVFGTEHFTDTQSIMQLVPAYMPWHLFWTYFVGVSLIAAGLSIAAKIQVQWSGLLFGIMMFLFVAMMDPPALRADLHNRISWVLLFREPSFGFGGWCLAALAMQGGHPRGKSWLVTLARVVIGVGAIFYGVEHFLHPINAPGVPLEKVVPAWIPGRMVIGYLTGAILLVSGVFILLGKKTRMAATYLGAWIVLLVLFVYGPILIASLLAPSRDVKVEGINYFFDTLLYAGAILALANASPPASG